MKKTIDINLAGLSFKIDEDAYIILHDYLKNIKKNVENKELADEVIYDVESRIVELVLKRNKSKEKVINISTINYCIEIIGDPEEFNTNNDNKAKSSYQYESYYSKKLFRNPKDKIIGGVLSGLSAYFGIREAIVLRLIFLLLLFVSGGFFFVLYIICWILIPEARTPSDFIQMRGGSINLKNVEKEIKDSFQSVGNKIEDWGSSVKSWKVSNTVNTFFEIIIKIFAIIFLIVFVGILIAGVSTFLGSFSFMHASISPVVEFFFLGTSDVLLLTILGFLLFLIPIFWIIYFLIGLVIKRRYNTSKWIKIGTAVVWAIALFIFIHTSKKFFQEFKYKEQRVEKVIVHKNKKQLVVMLTDDKYENTSYLDKVKWGKNHDDYDEDIDDAWFSFRDNINKFSNEIYDINKEYLGIKSVNLVFHPVRENNFSIEHIFSSRGKSYQEATKRTRNINNDMILKHGKDVDTLFLNIYSRVKKSDKWRNQKTTLRCGIPQGYKINVASSMSNDKGIYTKIVKSKKHSKDHHVKKYHSLLQGVFYNANDKIYCDWCINLDHD